MSVAAASAMRRPYRFPICRCFFGFRSWWSRPLTSHRGRLTQEKKKLELQESEVEDEILRLQRASTAAFNRLLRLRK